MGIVMQITMSALTVFGFCVWLDMANDGLPKALKLIGNICFYIIPIGLIIQIWQ